MTRAQTVDVLNDSTTLQSRIDTVLAAPDLDWANGSGWQPGDPLWQDPREVEAFNPDAQYVRRMFDLVDEYEGPMRCKPCGVSWSDAEACWMCGDPATARTMGFMSYGGVVFDEAYDWSTAMAEAMRPAIAQVNEIARRMAEVTATFHFTIDGEGRVYRTTDPEPVTAESRESWIRANAGTFTLVPEVRDPAAPTLSELSAGTDLMPYIQIPAGVEITAVAPVPLPEDISVTGRRRREPEFQRYYFNRPITETRRS